jgi:hypothetical protein
MQHKIFRLLFLTFTLFASCKSFEPKAPPVEPMEIKSKSNTVIKVKPLSTEKTHEGGLDTTKLMVK